jgi:hypothetical protein
MPFCQRESTNIYLELKKLTYAQVNNGALPK